MNRPLRRPPGVLGLAALLALAPSLAPAGAAALAAASPPAAAQLDNTAWVVSLLEGRAPLSGTSLSLRFEGGRVAGSDGCNRYSAPVTIQGTALRVSAPGISTKMACPPPVMRQAEAFQVALGRVQRQRQDARQLQLLSSAGRPLLVLVPQSQRLAGREWRVAGFNNGRQAVVSPILGTSLSLRFLGGDRLAGSAGCNRFTASVQVEGLRLRIGPALAGRRLCEGAGVMDQERQFLAALSTAASLRLEGETLELRRADGAIALSLRGAATP